MNAGSADLAGVEVTIRSIEAAKLAEDATSDSTVGFSASANLVESEKSPGKLALKFTIELDSSPEVAKITISGTATLKGEDSEIEALLAPKEGESTPPVFMKIYQKVYAILYLLSGSLAIPHPSPGLLNEVHFASPNEMAKANPNPIRTPPSPS